VDISNLFSRPEPFKLINFPAVQEMGLNITVRSDGETVDLSARKPVKGIVLDAEGGDVHWSDQAIDLAPHDPQTIQARGLNGRKLKIRFLGDGTL
jgi:beta-mannosidase